MKYIFLFLFLFTASYTVSAKKKDPASKTWTGYLIDKMCAKRKAADMQKLVSHTKTCMTEESCASSGYGVVVNSKFIPFDAKGNEIAANYLKTTAKENDFQVEVTGAMKKNKIAVKSIQ
jgi:hypothetical protein